MANAFTPLRGLMRCLRSARAFSLWLYVFFFSLKLHLIARSSYLSPRAHCGGQVLRLCAADCGPALSGAAATAAGGPASADVLAALAAAQPHATGTAPIATAQAPPAAGGAASTADRRFTVVAPVAAAADGGPVLGLCGNFQVRLARALAHATASAA